MIARTVRRHRPQSKPAPHFAATSLDVDAPSATHIDLLAGPFPGEFDAAYALDVIEHIDPSDEVLFVENIVKSLTPQGVLILGSPSLESQTYASPQSRAGHVNCKTAPQIRDLMSHFFHNVFLFSMNDEVVHTGYAPMAHYRLAIGCSRKET